MQKKAKTEVDKVKRERDEYKKQRDAFNTTVKTGLESKLSKAEDQIAQLLKETEHLKTSKKSAEKDKSEALKRLKEKEREIDENEELTRC